LTMQVQASGRRFNREAMHQFFERALEAARQVPGVNAAALVSQLPLSGDANSYGAAFERSPDVRDDTGFPVFRYAVSPEYFSTLGLPLRRGRLLETHDTTNSPRVVVVSESFAQRFPRGEAIGQRVYVGPTDLPPYTVVGVVGDVRQTSLESTTTDAVYITPRQWHFTDAVLWLVARTAGEPAQMAGALRGAVWSVDRHQPIVRTETMETLLTQSAGERRFAMILFEIFGIVAILLVTTGLYGVIGNSVDERTKEIGVRLALGATRAGILRMVLAQGIIVVGLGIGIGAMGAIATSGGMVSLLFGVTHLDSATYASVVGLLLAIAVLACGVPGWRATRVDPAITLRAE
jgi:putative ABC transport system permease protein